MSPVTCRNSSERRPGVTTADRGSVTSDVLWRTPTARSPQRDRDVTGHNASRRKKRSAKLGVRQKWRLGIGQKPQNLGRQAPPEMPLARGAGRCPPTLRSAPARPGRARR